MKTFTRQCYCQRNGVRFQCQNKFDATSIDVLYCPECSEFAARDTLLINLEVAFDTPLGIWGIKFNNQALKKQDPKFVESRDYFIDLFKDKKCTFEFIAQKPKKYRYSIIGLKGEYPSQTPSQKYSEKARRPIDKDLRKKHNPPRITKLN